MAPGCWSTDSKVRPLISDCAGDWEAKRPAKTSACSLIFNPKKVNQALNRISADLSCTLEECYGQIQVIHESHFSLLTWTSARVIEPLEPVFCAEKVPLASCEGQRNKDALQKDSPGNWAGSITRAQSKSDSRHQARIGKTEPKIVLVKGSGSFHRQSKQMRLIRVKNCAL